MYLNGFWVGFTIPVCFYLGWMTCKIVRRKRLRAVFAPLIADALRDHAQCFERYGRQDMRTRDCAARAWELMIALGAIDSKLQSMVMTSDLIYDLSMRFKEMALPETRLNPQSVASGSV